MSRPGPAPLVDERIFIPRTIEEAQCLYDALVASDVPVRVARGLVTWLIVLPEHRADDPSPDSLRRDYRRALLHLGSPPWEASEATVGELRSGELSQRHGRRRIRALARWRPERLAA